MALGKTACQTWAFPARVFRQTLRGKVPQAAVDSNLPLLLRRAREIRNLVGAISRARLPTPPSLGLLFAVARNVSLRLISAVPPLSSLSRRGGIFPGRRHSRL